MAKGKKGRKMVRNVARRVRAKAGQLDVKSIAMANVGGFAAAFAIDKIDDFKTKGDDGVEKLYFADKPLAAPLIVEGLAIAGSMFLKNEAAKVACYGAMGGAAAQMYAPIMDMANKDEAANGTATINGKEAFRKMIQRVGKRLDMHKAGKMPMPGQHVQILREVKQRGGDGMGMMRRLKGGDDTGSARMGGASGWRRFSSMGDSAAC